MMRKYLAVLLTNILCSCNFNANIANENEENDKRDAQSIAGFLYLYTANKSFDSIPKLMSSDFFKVTNKDKLLVFLKKKDSILGNYKDMKLLDWKTLDVNGSNSRTEYYLIYRVKYSKREVDENISMVKENGFVKIVGYSVKL